MKRALVYVFYPSNFKVMIRTARLLRATGRFEPIVFFDQPPYARDVDACRELGVECLGPDGEPLADSPAPPGRRIWPLVEAASKAAFARLPQSLRRPAEELASVVTALPQLGRQLLTLKRQLDFARRLLERQRIDLLVLPGDSVGYSTPALIRAGHERDIRSLIVPFSFSNPSDIAVDLRQFPAFDARRFTNRLVAAGHPSWVFEHEGRPLVRLPAAQALAFEWTRLAPPRPWVFHSGYADRICVESDYMLQRYRENGLPEEQLTVTGSPVDDVVAAALREAPRRRAELCQELGLPDRPLVVFSLGDFSYFFASSRAAEFRSQKELTAFWVDSLRALDGYSVVVSLHPHLTYDKMRHIEVPGLKISQRPVEELIPLGDFYVVSISTTTRIAIACGKPVIDHDAFAFRYTNFVDLPGVQIVETKAQFRQALQRTASDRAFRDQLTAHQARAAGRFGRLDGHANERIAAVADELSARASS